MRMRAWGAAAAATVALAGCSGDPEQPTPSPTVSQIPHDIQDFLTATANGDVDEVRSHLVVWNEAAGRNLTGDEISLECAEAELALVAPKAEDPELTAYVYTAGPIPVVRFESADGSSEGWGIEVVNDAWYWQPQAGACLDLGFGPSPSPSA